MGKTKTTKNTCTCGTGEPCCVHESEKACTCGTGEPCCVHGKEKGKQKETKKVTISSTEGSTNKVIKVE